MDHAHTAKPSWTQLNQTIKLSLTVIYQWHNFRFLDFSFAMLRIGTTNQKSKVGCREHMVLLNKSILPFTVPWTMRWNSRCLLKMTTKDVPWLGVKERKAGVELPSQTDNKHATSSSAQQQCEQGQHVLISWVKPMSNSCLILTNILTVHHMVYKQSILLYLYTLKTLALSVCYTSDINVKSL